MLAVLVALSATADAVSITLAPYADTGITVAAWDDTVLTTTDLSTSTMLDFTGTTKVAVIAIKDMFDIVEAHMGSPVAWHTVSSATLTLVHASGTIPSTVYVDRITTDWLSQAAGTNESNVNMMYSDISTSTPWSTGVFDIAADADQSQQATLVWNKSYRARNSFDVTGIVRTMFDTGVNYGFALYTPDGSRIRAFSSEASVLKQPSLEIVVGPLSPSSWGLVVRNGTSDGDTFQFEGAVVPISADAAPSGVVFDQWTGETHPEGRTFEIADVYAPNTTITMPAADLYVTATYSPMIYTLTVVSGSGSGSYTAGQVVDIGIDVISHDSVFVRWMGDTDTIADVYSYPTTLTMPAADISVTARIKQLIIQGDANDDNTIDIIDLNMILIDWGKSHPNLTDPRSDANGDGIVDITDLNIVLIGWGNTGNY